MSALRKIGQTPSSGVSPGHCGRLTRSLIRCASARRDHAHARWVFQADVVPRNYDYSLLDVRDAVEACSNVRSREEREQCFLNFGLDAAAVDEFYEPVMRMENAMQEHASEEDAVAQRVVRVASFFLFLAVGCKMM